MRCDECLPLIEEYFDGEAEESVAARVGAHLSACATCAAALDALSFEQEIYARYDRELEVTPDLWARVSAEIARTAPPESPAERRPFLSRAGAGLAAAAAALFARPALASSLALLIVGVTAGSLWLANRQRTTRPSEVAVNVPGSGVEKGGAALPADGGTVAPTPDHANVTNVTRVESGRVPADIAAGPERDGSAARRVIDIRQEPAVDDDDGEKLLAAATAPQASSNIVVFRPEEPAAADEVEALVLNASAPGREPASVETLGPGEKEVARHVERAQMLLRSIKNARASDDGAVDVAYEKGLSRRLLAESASLRLEAEVRGDKDTTQVLDQIEPFLLDIANMREKPSRDEVRSIRERVRKDEIVAALQVY